MCREDSWRVRPSAKQWASRYSRLWSLRKFPSMELTRNERWRPGYLTYLLSLQIGLYSVFEFHCLSKAVPLQIFSPSLRNVRQFFWLTELFCGISHVCPTALCCGSWNEVALVNAIHLKEFGAGVRKEVSIVWRSVSVPVPTGHVEIYWKFFMKL